MLENTLKTRKAGLVIAITYKYSTTKNYVKMVDVPFHNTRKDIGS